MVKFEYILANGQVALQYEDKIEEHGGFETPSQVHKSRTAIIVGMGKDVPTDILAIGRRVIMPTINKQAYDIGDKQFHVCNYLEIKLIDPVMDEEAQAIFLRQIMNSMPDAIRNKIIAEYAVTQ